MARDGYLQGLKDSEASIIVWAEKKLAEDDVLSAESLRKSAVSNKIFIQKMLESYEKSYVEALERLESFKETEKKCKCRLGDSITESAERKLKEYTDQIAKYKQALIAPEISSFSPESMQGQRRAELVAAVEYYKQYHASRYPCKRTETTDISYGWWSGKATISCNGVKQQ